MQLVPTWANKNTIKCKKQQNGRLSKRYTTTFDHLRHLQVCRGFTIDFASNRSCDSFREYRLDRKFGRATKSGRANFSE